jgi:hypothetical protein
MKTVRSSEAKTHLARPLDHVRRRPKFNADADAA